MKILGMLVAQLFLYLLLWGSFAGSALFANEQRQGFERTMVTGLWKTIDEKTSEPKSIIEIYEREGLIYGRIIKLFRGPEQEQDPVCSKCKGEYKGRKILGMEILRGLKLKNGTWSGGTILDPANGGVYRCRIWREQGKLKVQGFVAIFSRTQTWYPAE